MSTYPKPAPDWQTLAESGGGDLDQYFDFFFGTHRPPLMHGDRGWHPPADVYETEDAIVICVEIAGIDVKDVNLVLEKERLVLTGIRREVSGEIKRQYHKMEVPYGPFSRVFRLPATVCADNVKAGYEDGFLRVELKKREKPITRKAKIKIK